MAEDRAERDEDALAMERLEAVLAAVEAGDAGQLDVLLEPLHAADIADILEQIGSSDRSALLKLWHGGIDGEVLSEIDESIREEVIAALPESVVADAVRELETDDVVDILEDLEAPAQGRILDALESADRVAVQQAMAYPEYSAGRLMQREVVATPEHWTVGEAIDYLRSADELPDQFYHVILIDPRMKPTGYVTLGRVLSSARTAKLRDIAEDSFRIIKATSPEADVAYIFNQYHLISSPVVDEGGRLVGAITIDDAMAVLDDEHEEDMLRMAGVGDESSISDRVLETTRQRLPWLFVNLLTAILASTVIAQFENAIAKLVALAVLMPIVTSMGGNAATQSLTVAVRALATRDITGANVARVIRRETTVGLLNGVFFAILVGLVSWFWFDDSRLGLVIAAAMVINLVVAGMAGILVPLMMERAGVDPALASGTFVTTVTDVVGFSVFLGLAGAVML
ncbi:MAG: magnesium transporter [Paracoccaceae bacterium]